MINNDAYYQLNHNYQLHTISRPQTRRFAHVPPGSMPPPVTTPPPSPSLGLVGQLASQLAGAMAGYTGPPAAGVGGVLGQMIGAPAATLGLTGTPPYGSPAYPPTWPYQYYPPTFSQHEHPITGQSFIGPQISYQSKRQRMDALYQEKYLIESAWKGKYMPQHIRDRLYQIETEYQLLSKETGWPPAVY